MVSLPRGYDGKVSFVGRALRMWLACHMISHKIFADKTGYSIYTVRDWIYSKALPSDQASYNLITYMSRCERWSDDKEQTMRDLLQEMKEVDLHYKKHDKPGPALEDMDEFSRRAVFL